MKKETGNTKPFYKAWWFWTIVAVVILAGIGSAGKKDQENNELSVVSTNTESSIKETSDSPNEIEVTENKEMTTEDIIRARIEEKYRDTDVESITLNEHAGTDVEDDYIALVRLTWNVKNSGKTSKEMLSMYSSDLAATVAEKCPNVQEIAIFWTVPYLNDNAKCAYERKNGNMYEMDIVWGKSFE